MRRDGWVQGDAVLALAALLPGCRHRGGAAGHGATGHAGGRDLPHPGRRGRLRRGISTSRSRLQTQRERGRTGGRGAGRSERTERAGGLRVEAGPRRDV